MEPSEYDVMFAVEDHHWWYVGMRRIARAILDRYAGQSSIILDAGCGTGANLVMLGRYGVPVGLDLELAALSHCRQRGLALLVQGSVTRLPFADACFDLVTSFEVIYHRAVQSDLAALIEAHRVLKPGGWLLLRLPAYEWLRGRHDVVVHTRHRYTTAEVRAKVEQAGFRVVRLSYVNCLLFPLAVVKRASERLVSRSGGSDIGPPPPGNRFLAAVLGLEALWLRRWSLPWGLSVLCLARKP